MCNAILRIKKIFLYWSRKTKKLRPALPYHLWRRRRDSFLLSSKQLRRIKVCAFRIASVTAKNSSQDCFIDAFVRISPTYKLLSKIKRCPTGHPFILAEKERFEPSNRFWRLHDFQSCALDQTRRLLHVFIQRKSLYTNKLKNSSIFDHLHKNLSAECTSLSF